MNKRILTSSLTGLIFGLMFSFSAAANTSVQSNHTAASATATTKTTETTKDEQLKIGNLSVSQAEMLQDNISALRMQVMDNQQQNINWWLAAIALLGLILPYMFYQKERENMLSKFESTLKEIKEYSEKTQILTKQAEENASKAQALLEQIQNTRNQAEKELNELKQKTHDYNPEKQSEEEQQSSIEAAEKLSEHRDIPLIEQLRAQAILLSAKAHQSKSYQDHLQAFRGWKNVLKEDSLDEQASFNAGLQACYLHQKGNREQQIHWFPEIERYYRQALAIKPDMHDAAHNWGSALANEAQALAAQADTAAALEKWRDAEKKFQRALDIKPDKHEAANNWGTALVGEAQVFAAQDNTATALEKWRNAEEKYRQALVIKPDMHEAAYNWGNALADEAQALTAQGDTAAALGKWREAGEKYQQALDIKLDKHEAANNWGLALAHEAQALVTQRDTEAALKTWCSAEEKFQQALAIKPDMHEAAHNWLTCLSHEYHALKDNQPTKAQAKLQQARDLVNDFLSKNPQHKENLAYNHACLYALEGDTTEAVKQLRLAKQEVNSLGKKRIETDPDFNNIRNTPEFQTWFKEAFPESSAES